MIEVSNITLQEAYSATIEFFRCIQSITDFPDEVQLTLEEFEFVKSSFGEYWLVTLGVVSFLQDHTYTHNYRIFKVNAVTKEVAFMKKRFMGHQEDKAIGETTILPQEPIPEIDLSPFLPNWRPAPNSY